MMEPDLIGTVRQVRNWVGIGTRRQEMVGVFAGELEARQALGAVAGRSGGYQRLCARLQRPAHQKACSLCGVPEDAAEKVQKHRTKSSGDGDDNSSDETENDSILDGCRARVIGAKTA